MRNIQLCLLFLIVFFGCSNNNIEHQDGFGNYDLSSDGKRIVFSWIVNGKSSIYASDNKGNNREKIFSAQDGTSYLNPRFSHDGKIIAFISNEINSTNSAVCLGDLNSRKIERLTDTTTIKTEAIFSVEDKTIYFCSANEYGNSSILAPRAAHDFDVYSITRSNREIIRVTNLNAYSLGRLAVSRDTNIAFSLFAGDDGGIFQYNPSMKKLSSRAHLINDKLDKPSVYSNPSYSDGNKLFFSAYNRLILIDLKTQKGKVVFLSNFNITNIRYSQALDRIFFTEQNSDGTIYSINELGGDFQEIYLKP